MKRSPGDGRRHEHDRLARRSADELRTADRRFRQRYPHGRGDSRGALSAHAHRSRPAHLGGDAGRRPEPRSREDARSAAARARAAARIPEQDVCRLRAALRKRVGRRSARRGAQMCAGRCERLRLRDHPAAGLGAAREPDRPARARRGPGVCHAGGAVAAPRRGVRRDRRMDQRVQQVRGPREAELDRRAVRPRHEHERPHRGRVPHRARHDRGRAGIPSAARSKPSAARWCSRTHRSRSPARRCWASTTKRSSTRLAGTARTRASCTLPACCRRTKEPCCSIVRPATKPPFAPSSTASRRTAAAR